MPRLDYDMARFPEFRDRRTGETVLGFNTDADDHLHKGFLCAAWSHLIAGPDGFAPRNYLAASLGTWVVRYPDGRVVCRNKERFSKAFEPTDAYSLMYAIVAMLYEREVTSTQAIADSLRHPRAEVEAQLWDMQARGMMESSGDIWRLASSTCYGKDCYECQPSYACCVKPMLVEPREQLPSDQNPEWEDPPNRAAVGQHQPAASGFSE